MCSFMYSLSVYVCSGTSVTAEVEAVELEDGTKIQPVSVVFPEGNNIPAQDQVHPYTVRLTCFKTVLK